LNAKQERLAFMMRKGLTAIKQLECKTEKTCINDEKRLCNNVGLNEKQESLACMMRKG
jgi:hypothetical protein